MSIVAQADLAGTLEKLGAKDLDLLADALNYVLDPTANKGAKADTLAGAILSAAMFVADGTEVVELEPQPFPTAPDIPVDQIKWRVQGKPTERGQCLFVSYIDARDAADALDDWLGVAGWSEAYEEGTLADNPVLWCHLQLRFGDTSVVRSDVATYSKGHGDDGVAVGVKGLVSGAFKRAAAKAGIGRNVYALPKVWAPVRVDKKGNGWPTEESYRVIANRLKTEGHDVDRPVVDERTDDEDATPAETDWTKAAKTAIWHELGKDDAKAAEAYRAGLEGVGVPEPLEDEDTANRVIQAALAVAESPLPKPDPEPPQEQLAAPPAEGNGHVEGVREVLNLHQRKTVAKTLLENETARLWLDQNAGNPEWVFESAGRRAALGFADGDFASAQTLFGTMTGPATHPLSRDDFEAFADALLAP